MQWERITSVELGQAAKDLGVCVVAMGVLERHSDHLPLGTDYMIAHRIATLAAQQEPAVVFPPWYFGQVYEARAFPGTVTLRPALMVEVVQALFDEIARNGFTKIIAFNGHGGNTHFLHFLAQSSLYEEKPYTLYVPGRLAANREERWNAVRETIEDGHAGERETSMSLSVHPELVKTEAIPEEKGTALRRAEALGSTFTGLSWYANYPRHYAGDASVATKEKGNLLIELAVDDLAHYIAAVKADTVTPALQREYFQRERDLRA